MSGGERSWLTITTPPPALFVSVDSAGVRGAISPLDSAASVSVHSKGVRG
jgi:hypothetical protein